MTEKHQLQNLVHPGDVLAAAKILLGADANVLHYEVKKGTESVQGLMSMILRVVVSCEVQDGTRKECRFIVKRLPALEVQVIATHEMQVFPVESQFFRKCAPILRKKCPDLPLVRCLFARDDFLVFEDLSEKGFKTLTTSLMDLKGQILSLAQTRMLLRQLAKFHAASLDVKWVEVAPKCFEKDVLFEINEGKAYRTMMENSIKRNVAPVIRHLYPGENIEFYVEWLCGPKMWEMCLNYVKPNNRYVNVICHGDFWINNVMFRSNPDNQEPEDVCLIDMQTVRFAPQITDLLYFLYLCTRHHFRTTHEPELLRTYLEAFNAAAARTPDPTCWSDFERAYDEMRLFGVLHGLAMVPVVFAGEVAPAQGDELTAQQFENLLGGGDESWDAVAAFESDAVFRQEIQPLIEEVMVEMDKHNVSNREVDEGCVALV